MLGYEVTRWHPFLSGADRDVDAVLDRFLGRRELDRGWTPPMDAYVRDGNYVLRVDLPGVEPKDLDINVEGRLLTIKGRTATRGEGPLPSGGRPRQVRAHGEVAQRHRHRQDRGPAQERCHRGFGTAPRQGGRPQGPRPSGNRRGEGHRVQRRVSDGLAQPTRRGHGKGSLGKRGPFFFVTFSFSHLHDGLPDDPQAEDRVADHQEQHGELRRNHRSAAVPGGPVSRQVGEPHGDDVAGDDDEE